jgi:hypothetical protein
MLRGVPGGNLGNAAAGGRIEFGSRDTGDASEHYGAMITGVAEEPWTAGSGQGMGISFGVTANGGTTATEVLRISNSGKIGIGTIGPAKKLTIQDANEAGIQLSRTRTGNGLSSHFVQNSSGGALHLIRESDGASNILLRSYGDSYLSAVTGNVGIGTSSPDSKLEVVGNVKVTGDVTATTLSELSSRRWKENIEPLGEALEKVERLQGVSYNRKADGQHDIGFIAEEVGAVVPEVVLWKETGEAQSLNYGRLTALLVEAVKEQQAQIRALQEELATIKAGQATPAGQL